MKNSHFFLTFIRVQETVKVSQQCIIVSSGGLGMKSTNALPSEVNVVKVQKHIALRMKQSQLRDQITFDGEIHAWFCAKCDNWVYTNPDIHAIWHQLNAVAGKKVADQFFVETCEVAYTKGFLPKVAEYLNQYLPLTPAESDQLDAEIKQETANKLAELEALNAEALATASNTGAN